MLSVDSVTSPAERGLVIILAAPRMVRSGIVFFIFVFVSFLLGVGFGETVNDWSRQT